MQERLHKLLAHAGFGSRRGCELLIEDGRVTVNGRLAQVGDKGDPEVDDIRVNRQRIRAEHKVYFLINKPPGYLCTNDDPAGRKKVVDLLTGVKERVYPVGRLDADSRGLVIMTNDGDLAARLTHPRYEVPKTYEVEVDGRVTPEVAEKLVSGVWLSEGKTGQARLRVLHRGNARSQLEVTLREGRNREVRRMMVRLGHKVRRLTRTRIGHLSLHGLGPGKFRPLTSMEVADLYRAAAGADQPAVPEPRDRRGTRQPRHVARAETHRPVAATADRGPAPAVPPHAGPAARKPARKGPPPGAARGHHAGPGKFKGGAGKFKAGAGKFGKAGRGGGKPAAGDDRQAMARKRIRDFTA